MAMLTPVDKEASERPSSAYRAALGAPQGMTYHYRSKDGVWRVKKVVTRLYGPWLAWPKIERLVETGKQNIDRWVLPTMGP